MRDYQSLAHTRWDCKYHLIFIPKRRRKVIYGKGESLILTGTFIQYCSPAQETG